MPYTYSSRNYVHALQWGIGLELFLLGRDPWQVMLSTDHPNGGSFLSYPKLIRLLMDRSFRDDQLGRANQKAIRRTALLDGLAREYTLNEIAIITRAAPARRLGLAGKGHLGVGADADVTIYHDRADREEMFATPRYVLKAGELVVEDGELRRADDGMLLSAHAGFDTDVAGVLEPLFGERYTVRFEHYPVRDRRCASPPGSWRRRHDAALRSATPTSSTRSPRPSRCATPACSSRRPRRSGRWRRRAR